MGRYRRSFWRLRTWAVLAPLSSAAIVPGTVVVDLNRKSVQHLEGESSVRSSFATAT